MAATVLAGFNWCVVGAIQGFTPIFVRKLFYCVGFFVLYENVLQQLQGDLGSR